MALRLEPPAGAGLGTCSAGSLCALGWLPGRSAAGGSLKEGCPEPEVTAGSRAGPPSAQLSIWCESERPPWSELLRRVSPRGCDMEGARCQDLCQDTCAGAAGIPLQVCSVNRLQNSAGSFLCGGWGWGGVDPSRHRRGPGPGAPFVHLLCAALWGTRASSNSTWDLMWKMAEAQPGHRPLSLLLHEGLPSLGLGVRRPARALLVP